MKLNLPSFLLILPVAFSWIVVSENPQLVFVSLLVMAGAESLRQYFSATFIHEVKTPRRLFFFGVIYKDSEGFFLNRKSSAGFSSLSRSRKILLLVAVYVLTLSLKFSSAFEDVNFIFSAFFSLVITLWVYCGTYKRLSWVMLLQILGTTIAFAATNEANGFIYFIWLALSLWAQLQVYTWHLSEESRQSIAEAGTLTSAAVFFKSAAVALILIFCYQTADFMIPDYGDARPAASKDDAREATDRSSGSGVKKKEVRVPKKFVSNLAKYKLQASAIDFSKLKLSEIEFPSGGLSSSPFKLPEFKLSFGENRRELEDIRANLAGDKPVRSEDLDKLTAIARKIKSPPASGGGSEAEDLALDNANNKAEPDQTDKIIEDRIERLKGQVKEGKPNEDDAAAYARSRRELADDIDKMLQQDQKNTLAKEELKLQKFFERVLVFLKRFSLLIFLCFLAAWLLRQKAVLKHSEADEGTDLSLPKEVRVKLKHLYKLLLKGSFSPRDEVIKSYHLVDLAFKEFEYARKEDLPPVVFLERLKLAMPSISKSAKVPTELFSRVFYGDKNPDAVEITELRGSMRELMKKLRVI